MTLTAELKYRLLLELSQRISRTLDLQLLLRASGGTESLHRGGPALGLFATVAFEAGTVDLEPGDRGTSRPCATFVYRGGRDEC